VALLSWMTVSARERSGEEALAAREDEVLGMVNSNIGIRLTERIRAIRRLSTRFVTKVDSCMARCLPGCCPLCLAPLRTRDAKACRHGPICERCYVSLPFNRPACVRCAEPLIMYASQGRASWV